VRSRAAAAARGVRAVIGREPKVLARGPCCDPSSLAVIRMANTYQDTEDLLVRSSIWSMHISVTSIWSMHISVIHMEHA
jgi:hypothetical protein